MQRSLKASVASPGSFMEDNIISGTSLGMFSATICKFVAMPW